MTFFDIAVLVVIGLAGLGGLSRGFVHEVLALAAWVAAIVAIYLFHAPLTDIITAFFRDNGTNAALIAFLILLIVPIFALRLTARWLGNKTRNSPLGFIDRILGLGFGLLPHPGGKLSLFAREILLHTRRHFGMLLPLLLRDTITDGRKLLVRDRLLAPGAALLALVG